MTQESPVQSYLQIPSFVYLLYLAEIMGNVDKFVARSFIELFITFCNYTGLYRVCEQNLQKRSRLD